MALLYEHQFQDKYQRLTKTVTVKAVPFTIETTEPQPITINFGTGTLELTAIAGRELDVLGVVSVTDTPLSVAVTEPGAVTVNMGSDALALTETILADRKAVESLSLASTALGISLSGEPAPVEVNLGTGSLSLSTETAVSVEEVVQVVRSVSFGDTAIGVETTPQPDSITVNLGVGALSLTASSSYTAMQPSPTISDADINNDFAENWSVINAYWQDTASPYTVRVLQGTNRIETYEETGVTTTNDYSTNSFEQVNVTDTDEWVLEVTDDNGQSDSFIMTP